MAGNGPWSRKVIVNFRAGNGKPKPLRSQRYGEAKAKSLAGEAALKEESRNV